MKHKRKRVKRFPTKSLLFVILIVGTCFIWTNIKKLETSNIPLVAESQDRGSAKLPDVKDPTDVPEVTMPVHIAEITDTRCLELVNLEYSIKGEPDTGAIISAWPDVPVRVTEITLHEVALAAVKDLFDAAREENIKTFYVSSGYRDYDKQKQTYEDSKSFAQPPNHSEHQTGLAVDILATGVTQSDMAKSREGQWLSENAWKYGLILRYTEDKQDITGIPDEAWHFRYVGLPHAWYCKQNNLCFEEYIKFLQDGNGYQRTLDGVTYSVLYQTPQDGIIYLPESKNYSISGDNTGSFIVTVWE